MDTVLSKGYAPLQIERFLQELAWREYWQRVWQHFDTSIFTDIKQPQPNVQHRQVPTAVIDALTGLNAIDAGIKQLYDTGYMHNHVRMYTASLACNIGGAHWLQPANWMYYHLLDGDLASNALSWQWVAGSFSSKKYYFDQQNVNKFTHTSQRGTFMDKTYEEIALMDIPQALEDTVVPKLTTILPQTSMPVIDRAKPTLIYNSYNLSPIWHNDRDVNRVLLLEPSHFEKYPVSAKVLDFIKALAENIPGLQIFTGEFADLEKLCGEVISIEHPAFYHYKGVRESREWIAPQVTGYYTSFFAYWKQVAKTIC